MRDIVSYLGAMLTGILGTLSATSTALAVDLQAFNAAMLVITNGVGGITFDGTNKIEIELSHSDDGLTYTLVTAVDLDGKDAPITVTNGIVKSFITATVAGVTRIGYVGNKRYLKARAVFSGTHGTGTALSVLVLAGHPAVAPV